MRRGAAGDAADLIALRFVPARFFGVFMSVHPVLAAGVGMLLLGQLLGVHEWIGIAVVVLANAAAVAAGQDDPSGREGDRCACATGITGTASSPSCCTG